MNESQIAAIRATIRKWNPDDTHEQIEQQVQMMVQAIVNAT